VSRRGLEGIDDAPDTLADEQPVLASCYGASAADVSLLGKDAGQCTAKLTGPVRVALEPTGAVAEVGGVNVRALRVEGWDRARLERLCRYSARPPLAMERLSEHGDGRLRVAARVTLERRHVGRAVRAARPHRPALCADPGADNARLAVPVRGTAT